MLTTTFVEWWHRPWLLTPEHSYFPQARGDFALRHAYPHWCTQAEVVAALPTQFETAWCSLAELNPEQLRAAARLFSGILLASLQQHARLDTLSSAERKWCLGIAATQPLKKLTAGNINSISDLESSGMDELALQLNMEFPGLWSRLRLQLPAKREPAAAAQHPSLPANMPTAATLARARRCWQLCCQYTAGKKLGSA